MAVNKYFNNFAYKREQDLVEDLTIESIKMYGQDMKYIPRTVVKRDDLYGEDTLSKFTTAADVEMYIKNTEGFEGEGDFLSKFGLEIRDSVTFTVARKRFDQIRTEKLLTEVGYNYAQESADLNVPFKRFLANTTPTLDNIQLEEGTANNYSISSSRPLEGDLVFFPMVDKLFEIKFVEHESVFYQTGRLQTYDLRCELFDYSSEAIDTGFAEIDKVEDQLSLDVLKFQFDLEAGNDDGKLKSEDGGSVIQEFTINTTDATANNTYFQAQADSIIDFSEGNPFSEIDRY
jgi:hypothetical protein